MDYLVCNAAGAIWTGFGCFSIWKFDGFDLSIWQVFAFGKNRKGWTELICVNNNHSYCDWVVNWILFLFLPKSFLFMQWFLLACNHYKIGVSFIESYNCVESMHQLFSYLSSLVLNQIKIYDGFSLAFSFAVRASLHHPSPFFPPYLNVYSFPLETRSSADQPITQLAMFVCSWGLLILALVCMPFIILENSGAFLMASHHWLPETGSGINDSSSVTSSESN